MFTGHDGKRIFDMGDIVFDPSNEETWITGGLNFDGLSGYEDPNWDYVYNVTSYDTGVEDVLNLKDAVLVEQGLIGRSWGQSDYSRIDW